MSIVIYALNILPLNPDGSDWSRWVDGRRVAAASLYLQRDDRARCIGAGLLLAHAVRVHHPAHEFPPRPELDGNGKPYLPEIKGWHFNISHSGQWVVCAVGNHPLGVDIERMGPSITDLAQSCFAPPECAYLRSLPEADREIAFLDLWVLRESYMKATGLGFRLPPDRFRVHRGPPPFVLHAGQRVPFSITLCDFEDHDYRLALAVNATSTPFYRIEIVNFDSLLQCIKTPKAACLLMYLQSVQSADQLNHFQYLAEHKVKI
jgi:4'-phosphopantetheinyl transferase